MSKKIVIIGGGIAGLGIANTLVEKVKDKAEITVINKEDFYFAGPSRPLLLTNEQEYGRIIRGYEMVGKKGINVKVGNVYKIDPENRRVYLSESSMGIKNEPITYDYLVLAPGIVFDGSSINGYEKYWYKNTTVYDPGRVNVLKNRLWNENEGSIVVYAPKAPYRCAPAPTETVLLAHTVLTHRKVREKFKIIHIDANDMTQPPFIADIVKEIYDKAGIQLVTGQEIIEIGEDYVVTKSGEKYKFTILALLEPNRAPRFVEEAGLGSPFVEIRSPLDLRHPKYDDILAAGDAAKLPFPKNQEIAFESSLFAANKILEMEGISESVPVQYAFVGWAYMGNLEGKLETISLQFQMDLTVQPPKPAKDPQLKRDYTLQKDRWEQAYLGKLFGYS
ncbi:FAD-dependent oxidoreductase [Saccharolobus shibatae]|uniref:Sulfide dehydrogenase [flavocytochrome C] flavoprotein chain n=2 Tax=Saccharolobus shibatae TaxID=2286 RepID=A0A8F5BQ30_SACSH|nr:FAD/NAD(P)-binding oxidoreductase [Saccharolobus shibatae]QXJ29213.1 Sulfide dehydrogenase [flavocytochrome C] flavoprotein chain precursor [Saccharolobus shibatae B12]QXJ32457.1 Sulfide dehydrogenase [flavocytochrome C] flavoprotein chain precursor [Saccharolobus shibatae]